MNKLIVIGYTGQVAAYLNLTREEAIKRYLIERPTYIDGHPDENHPDYDQISNIEEIEFEDSFLGYAIWGK